MSLPNKYANLPIEVKYNLTSYLACMDCKWGIERLKKSNISYSQWKVEWAGICALLKTSVHLMKAKDTRSCLPQNLRSELRNAYEELGKNKERYPLFWNFIDKERHNILKEYEFSAYETIIKPDGTTRHSGGLLDIMAEGEKEALLIRGGEYRGRNAFEVLTEAVSWVENYIFSAVRRAGFDPNERRYAGSLLPIKPIENTLFTTILTESDAKN